MVTLTQLTELLGWASVLNIGMLLFSTALLLLMRPFVVWMHSMLFGLDDSDLPLFYFKYLALYKILTLVFIVSPYLSLKIMGH